MIGLFIQLDNSDEKYVLTNGKSNEYPDLQIIDNNGLLKSLKDERKAKDKAKELYESITGNTYPINGNNTHTVLKTLFAKITE